MKRLAAILGLCLAVAASAAPPPELSPGRIGARAAEVFLGRPDFMMYEVDEVRAVHYAEVAAAYGALRLASIAGDEVLAGRVAARHRRLVEEKVGNSRNHVDANVYGVWPLAIFLAAGDERLRTEGLAFADDQWRAVGTDGLTTQARYWIDDVWMIGLLQIEAWRATRDPRYLDRAALTARRYVEKLQQPNGLFHHGPDAPFFWARGNGWVAAGLAEVLSELPAPHPDYPAVAAGYRRMMAALLQHQSPDGMWRQLIDRPEAWEESSGTAMFGYAMAVGVQRGILTDPAYADAYDRAWSGLVRYVEDDGRIRQVCVGTGQSRDVEYYLERPVETGDLHGQAALLWFASAMAGSDPPRTLMAP